MRKQRIIALHRQYGKPTDHPVFIMCEQDPPDTVRSLDDIETLISVADAEMQYGELVQFSGDAREMTLEQFAAFFGAYGTIIKYGRVRNPESPYYGKKIVEPYCEFFRPH